MVKQMDTEDNWIYISRNLLQCWNYLGVGRWRPTIDLAATPELRIFQILKISAYFSYLLIRSIITLYWIVYFWVRTSILIQMDAGRISGEDNPLQSNPSGNMERFWGRWINLPEFRRPIATIIVNSFYCSRLYLYISYREFQLDEGSCDFTPVFFSVCVPSRVWNRRCNTKRQMTKFSPQWMRKLKSVCILYSKGSRFMRQISHLLIPFLPCSLA